MHRFMRGIRNGTRVASREALTDDQENPGTDLWTAFNVVQENSIRGGLRGRMQTANGQVRRTTTREVGGIDQTKAINRALWMLTERMAQIKTAA